MTSLKAQLQAQQQLLMEVLAGRRDAAPATSGEELPSCCMFERFLDPDPGCAHTAAAAATVRVYHLLQWR